MPTALITGGSNGLGFESAKALLAEGYEVIITGRNSQKLVNAENKLNSKNLSWIANDISDFEAVEKLASQVSSIDLLMNNAGQMGPPFSRSAQGHEIQMATNHLGHFLLTRLLWQKLSKSNDPRVIHLSSTVHRNGRPSRIRMSSPERRSAMTAGSVMPIPSLLAPILDGSLIFAPSRLVAR